MRYERAFPGNYYALFIRHWLQRFRGSNEQALETARLLGQRAERVPGEEFMGSFAWLRDLQTVDPEAALAVYVRLFPELTADLPGVDTSNYAAAASLALLRIQIGDEAAGARLLRNSLAAMETMPVVGIVGHGFADVMAHLILGDSALAMEALRKDLAAGWRASWWFLRIDPVFEPLWKLPEFQSLMAGVEAEMAGQLANLREMERRGELVFAADLPTPSAHASGASPADPQ